MDLDSNPDVLLVRKHLVEHLGRPDEVFEVRGSPIPSSPVQALHLSYFAPGGPESPVVFATCGACLYEMKDGRRVEAIMLFRREPRREAFEPIRHLLASFALFAEAHGEVVRVGDVIRASEDLRRFSSMDSVLFLPPVPFVDAFHRIPLTQSRFAEVIWILPVYGSEASYALRHGPQALMVLFAALGLDLTEMDRDEANTLIQPEDARVVAAERAEQNERTGEPSKPFSARPKIGRRPEGPGSFEVVEDMDAVTVVRRGVRPKAAPQRSEPAPGGAPHEIRGEVAPSVEPPARAPSAANDEPGEVREPAKPPPVRRRPVVAPIPQPEPVIRFDLGERDPKGAARRQPIAAKAAEMPERTESARAAEPETPEAKAEAKRKRVEELKAKAADVARRREQAAKERTEAPPEEPASLPPPSQPAASVPPRSGPPASAPPASVPPRSGPPASAPPAPAPPRSGPPGSVAPPSSGTRQADSDPRARTWGDRDQRQEAERKGDKGHGGERK